MIMIIIMLKTAPCISGQKGNNIGGPRKKSSGWAGIPSRKSEYTSQDEDNDDDDEDDDDGDDDDDDDAASIVTLAMIDSLPVRAHATHPE